MIPTIIELQRVLSAFGTAEVDTKPPTAGVVN
jgi:hypothetical protein